MNDDWKPVAAAGRALEASRLTPVEGYLLSRIDGATTVAELALISGMADSGRRISDKTSHKPYP